MRKGIVKISPELLISGLTFPFYWVLLSIQMNEGDRAATAVISGPEFPEVPDGGEPKECKIIVHKQQEFTFEVKELP